MFIHSSYQLLLGFGSLGEWKGLGFDPLRQRKRISLFPVSEKEVGERLARAKMAQNQERSWEMRQRKMVEFKNGEKAEKLGWIYDENTPVPA
jgi:hypothetical protein